MGGPFTLTFDFFPFNIDSGPRFLVIYAGIAIIGILLAKAVQARAIRRSEEATKAAMAVKEQPAGYRVPAGAPWAHQLLTIGFMPMREEHLRIAYLKGGNNAVAGALVASAVAHGWLVTNPHGSFGVGSPGRGVLAEEQALSRELLAGWEPVSRVMEAAHKIAGRWESSYEDDLVRAGLLRTQATRTAGRWAALLIGAAILAIGAIRALRGGELGRPVGLLIFEMVCICIALVVILFARVERITTTGKAYLEWIDAATTTLRADVQAGRDQVPADVLLAASLAGMFVLPALASAATASPDALRHFAAASAGTSSSGGPSSSCSSSSCSSSSCSGGSGCGGSSGCGGGGGCGG
jgi:uncharacterized protein (TIGR04222 family)